MAQQSILRVLSGLVVCVVVGGLTGAAAQVAPGQAGQQPGEAASQPTSNPDTQKALEKLLQLREQMRQEQERQEQEKRSGGAASQPAGQAPGVAPVISSQPTPAPAAPGEGQAGEKSAEQLRAAAKASTQRAPTSAQVPPARPAVPPQEAENELETPEDFVGPPVTLVGPRPGVVKPVTVVQPVAAPVENPVVEEGAPGGETAQPARAHQTVGEGGEWFNFVKFPWDQVVMYFVERIGKPLMDPDGTLLMLTGELTYVTTRRFTKDEAIDELNLIMQEQGYRFVESEHHIRIIPTNEMTEWVPLKYTFNTVEAFEQADPREMDYVIVYYQVQDVPAQLYVDVFSSALPDYARVTAMDDSNQIKIVACARDVRKFLALKDYVNVEPKDPRELRIFDIETNAADIEGRVRQLLNIGGTLPRPTGQPQMQMVRDPRTGRMIPQPVPQMPQPAGGATTSEVQMVADERTNSIIVKATPDKIKEIEFLIKTLDKKPDIGKFYHRVFEVKHADATAVAALLQSILQQEQGGSSGQRTPAWQLQQQMQQMQMQMVRDPRTGRMVPRPVPQQQMPGQMQQIGVSPEDISVEGLFERAKKTIKLIADPRTNSLIVYANDEGFKRVEDVLLIIDQPLPDTYKVFVLENVRVGDVAPLVTQILQGIIQSEGRGGRAPSVVPDESRNAFHVIAERAQMEQIENLLEQVDVPAAAQERHVIKLQRLRPSQVGQMVQTLLAGSSGGASAASMPPMLRGRGGMGAPSAGGGTSPAYQVIWLDEAQLLIVMCSPQDWERIEETIRMWDEAALTNTPQLETFTVEKGNPQTIAATLQNFYRSYEHPVLGRSAVVVQADGKHIMVQAVVPALEEIGALLEQLDQESTADKIEILPLVNADATQVAQQAQALFNRVAGPRGPVPGSSGPLIQAEAVTNSLIVVAEAGDLDKIKTFAMQMDQKIGAQATEQRFYTMRYAQAQEVAAAVQSIFGTGPGSGRGAALRSQIRAMAAGSQVIVESPKEKFTPIEAFIKQLDDPQGHDMQVKVVKLPGTDVSQVAQMLTTTLGNLPRPDRLRATFIPDASTESIIVSAPADMWPQIDTLVGTFVKGAEDLSVERRFYAVTNGDAAGMAEIVKTQLQSQVAQQKGQILANRISVSVDDRQNQLIINGPKFVHTLAEPLIKELDKSGPDTAPVTIAVKYADASQIAQTLTAMFPPGQRGRNAQQDVQVTVSNGQLVVRAPRKKLDEVMSLVAALDAPPSVTGIVVKTYQLKVLSATQVQAQVALFLTQMKKNVKPGELAPGAFAEPTTNTLVVMAPPEVIPTIEEIIEEIEGQAPPSGKMRTYTLKNVRAEQIATNVDAMLKAKVAEREGARKQTIQTSVFSDAAGNRLFVYAPDEYQEMAGELVAMVDAEVDTSEIVHILPLTDADAGQVAQSLTAMLQSKAKGGAPTVRVASDVGSNTVMLGGLPKDVAEVESWIKDLEINSVRVPELQTFTLQHSSASEIEETLKKLFPQAKNPQDAVTITADDYSGRLIVTANKRKMRQVEAFIQQLDQAPEAGAGLLAGGRQLNFVDINRGSASEIAWDVRDLLPDEDKGGPNIESDWYGEYIRVTCRPSEFPEIERLIRQFERRAKPENVVRTYKPKGNTEALIGYLKARDVDQKWTIEQPAQGTAPTTLIEDLWQEGEEPPQLQKNKRGRTEPEKPKSDRVGAVEQSRAADGSWLSEIEAEVCGGGLRPATGEMRVRSAMYVGALTEEPAPPARAAERKAVPAVVPPVPKAASKSVGAEAELPVPKEETRIVPQADGTLLIYGPRKQVDEVTSTIDTLQEDLAVGEVIRIFRFHYGDVSAAAEILTMMFDVQQRQSAIIMPQMQPQRGQQGRGGDEGREGRDQQGGFMGQIQSMIGGGKQQGSKSTGQLRIATDPGHNYLIVKCDETALPEIRRLLRELDIPPGEVQVHIIQLKNLLAEETAENIKDVLGISKVQQRRGGNVRQPMMGRPGQMGPQQQLMEMLQQQLVSVPGVEGGAKVERVEIVANSLTNSLLVSAPPEVMSLIEKVIGEMEDLQGPDVVGIYHYKVKNARMDDLVPLLEDIFGSAGSGGGGGGSAPRAGRMAMAMGGGGSSGRSPSAMGPVSISGDPRTNTIIYTCQKKDAETVEEQISKLDISGAVAEAETYVCQWGDAESIASIVEPIFGASGGSPAAGRGPRSGGEGGAFGEIRIAAEPTTNTITIWGPLDKRDLIFKKIEELDRLSQSEIKDIAVKFADAEELAARLSDVFAGGGAQPAAGRTPRRPRSAGGGGPSGVTNTGRIMILGDKAAKKLLVRAPEDVFAQIQSLVATLDQPDETMKLKRFQLTYADAATVVENVKSAMAEYVQIAKGMGDDARFDAFTAVADPRTNSVTVVGSEKTFLFVEQVLAAVDVATPPDQKKDFRIFMLERSDAVTVADAINSFATGGEGGTPSGGRRPGGRGGMPGGGAAGQARELSVFAFADEATNSVMIFGRNDDIDAVEAAVIEPLEQSIADRMRIESIEVANVPPSQIVGFIWQFIDQGAQAPGTGGPGRGGRAGQATGETGPQIVPNDTRKTLIVRGTKRQVEEVRDLVQRFDDQALVGPNTKLFEVPLGQDPVRLAQEIQDVINQAEEQRAQASGRQPRRVVLGADSYANVIIAGGDPTLFGEVESLMGRMEEITGRAARKTTVLKLRNVSAQDAEELIKRLQQSRSGGGGGGGGGIRPAGSSSGGSGIRTPSGGGTPRRPSSTTPPGGTRRPSAPPTPPANPPRPQGGGGAQPQAESGGLSLDTIGSTDDTPLLIRPSVWVEPYVAAMPISPVVALLLADNLAAGQAQDEPSAAKAPATRRAAPPKAKPASRPASSGDEEQPPVRKARETSRPATLPAGRPVTRPAEQPKQTAEKPAGPTEKPVRESEPGAAPVTEEGARLSPEMLQALEAVVAGEEPTSESVIEGMTGVSGMLRGEVTATAIDSQQIMIQGDERDVAFIEQILQMMEATTTGSLIEVFPIENLKATAMAPILDKAVKAWIDARTSRPGPQDKFSINAEARSNSLIVSASEPIMDVVRGLVEKLDVAKEGMGTDFKLIPLEHIRAAEAATLLRPTIEKLNKMRDVPQESQASIDVDDRSNSVLIIGTPKDVEEIQRLVRSIDVEITSDVAKKSFVTADVILIQLKNGNADDVAKVLTDMIKAEQEAAVAGAGGDKKTAGKPYVKKLKLRLADGSELPELNLEYPIRIIAEKGTNSLIIFSTKDNNEALQALVGVFDTLPLGSDTDVKVFTLQYAAAETVAKLLEDTFKDKSYLNRPSEGDAKAMAKGVLPPVPPGLAGKGLPYPLVVQHDARSNTVVLIGRSDAVVLAGGLIKELDRPTVDLGVKSYVIQLRNAQATQLAEKLKKLMDDRAKAVGGDKNAARDNVVVQPDERSNQLIVMATEEMYDLVEDLVLQLDAAVRYGVVDIRYRLLQYADAVKMQGLLEETFKSRQEAEGKLNKEAKDTLSILADVRSNSLLLTGTRDYLAEAESLVAQLDQPFEGTVQFEGIKVRLNSATNIAALLKDMIEKALKGQDSKLKGTPIYVVADPVSDTLLLAAAREDMEVLRRWVEIMDRPSEIDRMTKIIPLERGIAEDVSKAVQDIFKRTGGAGGAKGGEIDVTISADKTTNSIVAFGPPALLKDIEDFVKRLDNTEAQKGAVVRMFKLQQADAQDAGELIQRILDLQGGSVGGRGGSSGGGAGKEAAKQVLLVFQREHPELGMETLKAVRTDVTVISDLRTNSLVVTAPPESMALMESLVAAVDVPPDAAKIRVFQLRNGDAEQMVKMLEDLFAQKTATGRTGGGTSGGEPERVLTLAEGGGEGGRQEIAFTTDIRTNSVIAAGTPGYLDLVEQMILDLDTQPIKDRETAVYPPRNITAKALSESLKEFSDAEQKRLQDIGKDVSVAVKQERQITVIPNEDANRLIIDTDPRFRETVMRVVDELDQPPPQVIIQVLIIEVTMDNELDLGMEFAFQDLQYTKAGPADTTTFDYVGGTDIGAAGSGLGGFSFTITGADFNFLFRTLQNEGNLKVLSRPQIVAMDNKKASIDISNDVPYVSGTQTSTTGQIATSVSRQKVGIKLEVTPQINPDGLVRMEIKQEVSDVTGSTVDVGPGVTAPVFFTREADTTISVQDNETVVLGGLITARVESREQKVPLIGDIPGLGLLFRNQNDTSKRTELLLVLTPHVVRTPDEYRSWSGVERDRLELIGKDTLSDPIMQGLQIHPENEGDTLDSEGQAIPLHPEQSGPREELRPPTEEQYGPLQPALRGNQLDPADDPESYNVPVATGALKRR